MTFNSWEFILFYPTVLLLYFLLPKKMKWPMLLIASYFFYMCYQAELVFLIFGTTLVSWVSSKIMEKYESRKALRKICLAVTLVVSLGVLFFYKYFDFLSDSVFGLAALFGAEVSPITLNLVLPVGISFYTFQTLSYVIDVYRGEIKTERNFFFYALFVSFFPQLVAGPIERPDNLIPQLRETHKWSRENLTEGAKFMLLGFFKKICVADIISGAVNSVYNSPEQAGAISVIIATVLFAVQIYCDFSGYTDIAIGCARIMGIRLMKNFDHPYMASSIKEFWSRWHISLSSWFKDYLYIPLGGNRKGKVRTLINLMIVFLVSGLWHGAAWTFVIWGAIHGIYQIIGNLTIKKRNALVNRTGRSDKDTPVLIIRRIFTFILVDFAWLFFRANSISDAGVLLRSLFFGWEKGIGESLMSMGLNLQTSLLIVFAVFTLILLDRMVTYEGKEDSSRAIIKNGAFTYVIWAVLLCWLLLLSKDMISTFIYFQF